MSFEAPESITPGAKYYVVCVADLHSAAYCVDHCWVGICSESSTPHAGSFCILFVPSLNAVVGYGAILGARTLRTDHKDIIKREIPSYWDGTIRVGWIRAAQCNVGEFDVDTQLVLKTIGSEFVSNHNTKWVELFAGGQAACTAIDTASMRVLPLDLREMHLNPEAALALAQKNNEIHRRGGGPRGGGGTIGRGGVGRAAGGNPSQRPPPMSQQQAPPDPQAQYTQQMQMYAQQHPAQYAEYYAQYMQQCQQYFMQQHQHMGQPQQQSNAWSTE